MENCDIEARTFSVNVSIDSNEVPDRATAKIVTVSCIYSIVIVLTIAGNLAVILAYKTERNISRAVGNIFIVNLAMVGLIVGSCFLTINCIWLVTDEWIFGEYPCKVWLVVDYTTSYMLVVSMIYISFDRLLQIKLGMNYFKFQTIFQAKLMIGSAWLIILTYYTVIIYGWASFTGTSVIDYQSDCEMETICSQGYNLAMVFVEFLFPFSILLFLNVRVFWEIRLRAKGLVLSKSSGSIMEDVSSRHGSSRSFHSERRKSVEDASLSFREKVLHHIPGVSCKRYKNANSLKYSNVKLTRGSKLTMDDTCDIQSSNSMKDTSGSSNNPVTEDSIRKQKDKNHHIRLASKNRREFKHCFKAGITLACLVGVFVICWLPITVLSAFFSSHMVSELWWEIATNLLWCNATLNPILYALTNTQFRKAFRKFALFRNICKFTVRRPH
ncbi:Octopamine receptor [Holothuria leucospilota]|uniref:Octopamine receptor n=1 Tax=Holothuria leucospilota TaxID=206669 RepID=A0A9Q1BTE3_HOLLE|nr:Octopamine receptor [Holothuria leucospilota]